jgi:hypothetical protein
LDRIERKDLPLVTEKIPLLQHRLECAVYLGG